MAEHRGPISRRLVASCLILGLVGVAGCDLTEPTPTDPAIVTGVDDNDGLNGIVLPTPWTPAPVTLTDTEGSAYTLADDATAPITLVFFGYTHCPDVCQIVMSTLAVALTQLDEAQRAQVEVWFVTTDPARDTADVLRPYLDRFNALFGGLRGDLGAIRTLGESLGVSMERDAALPDGGYDVTHTDQIIGIQGGLGTVVWTAQTSPGELSEDLRALLEGSS